jgi:hypothetical protein
MTRPTILVGLHLFVAAETYLSSRCLAPKRGIHLTEPLPCNDRNDTLQTYRLMRGIYEVRVEMGSGAVICMP